MFSNIGSGEVIIVVLVLIFLFGGKKLPELARGLGESSRDLKKIKKELEGTISDIKSDEKSGDKIVTPEDSETKGGETSNA